MHVLVVVDESSGADTLEENAPIVHTASPRLYVVRVAETELSELGALPGVIAVTTGELPDHVTKGLDTSETIFATAFAAGQAPKERPGNGLDWDAPGFEPPDALPSSGRESAETRPDSRDGRDNHG